MTILKAEDIHCEMCVSRISKALTEANIKFEVNLENKTVSIDGDQKVVIAAKEIMDDLGFDTVEV